MRFFAALIFTLVIASPGAAEQKRAMTVVDFYGSPPGHTKWSGTAFLAVALAEFDGVRAEYAIRCYRVADGSLRDVTGSGPFFPRR